MKNTHADMLISLKLAGSTGSAGQVEKTSRSREKASLSPKMTATMMILYISSFLCAPSLGFLGRLPAFGASKKIWSSSSIHKLYTSGSHSDFTPNNRNLANAAASTQSDSKKTPAAARQSTPKLEDASIPKYNLTLLLIDHYDSFTYNLFDMLAQLCVNPPIVLATDAYDDWSDIVATMGDTIDGVILSPGPGTPTHPDDIGTLSPSIIQQNPELPILGVCLGHQIMGHVYGATVDLCGPVHGQVRTIEQEELSPSPLQIRESVESTTTSTIPIIEEPTDPIWKDIPSQINVTRYHSLAVRLTPPPPQTKDRQINGDNNSISSSREIPLRPTAFTMEDNPDHRILMGMSHTKNPHFGVQFHPESIGSDFGHQLLRNFCDVCQRLKEDTQQLSAREKEDEKQIQSKPRLNGHDRERGPDNNAHNNKVNGDAVNGAKENVNGLQERVNGEQTKNGRPIVNHRVLVYKVPATTMSPLEVYEEFLADEPFSVWLDTSMGIQSASSLDSDTSDSNPSYSSILGAGNAPIEYYGKEYDTSHRGLFQYDRHGQQKTQISNDDILTFLQKEHANATDRVTMVSFDDDGAYSTAEIVDNYDILPFDFRGGHVGYLGYEVRHDSQLFLEKEEHGGHNKSNLTPNSTSWEQSLLSPSSSERREPTEHIPTAAFPFLDKSWVYDHSTKDWYLICVVDHDESTSKDAAMEWMHSTALRMKQLCSVEKENLVNGNNGESNGKSQTKSSNALEMHQHENKLNGAHKASLGTPVVFSPNRSPSCYNQNFADCQEQIRLGESYELCLTNKLEAKTKAESSPPLGLYKILRKRNPAPFSAFLNWNARHERGSDASSLAVCCSSPERFVSVKRKRQAKGMNGSTEACTKLQVEAKPIKGTCARVIPRDKTQGHTADELAEDQRRAFELQSSVKNRAENLMIVDLLRNDLSRVCEIGSVHVSNLMDIESYATVHQMVSTIRGTLDPSKATAVDVLKATFPGGSMTGAPKIRTMEILDRLEQGVSRGPYSGCLGYISMNGCMDMNIVIRTAVLTSKTEKSKLTSSNENDAQESWEVSIGAGGAITALSESTDEYEEMLLKASAIMRAVEEWASEPTDVSTLQASKTNSEGNPVMIRQE